MTVRSWPRIDQYLLACVLVIAFAALEIHGAVHENQLLLIVVGGPWLAWTIWSVVGAGVATVHVAKAAAADVRRWLGVLF